MLKLIITVGALAALAPAPAAIAAPAVQQSLLPGTVHVVLEFVHAARHKTGTVTLDPASCGVCSQSQDPAFARENAHETLVDLRLPSRRYLELAFTGDLQGVRRVLLEKTELPFRREGNRLLVEVPPVSSDLVDTGEFSTNIVEPGMVMRVEHLDTRRLAGYYANKPAPLQQRRAATNIEFAMREAVRELGLGEHVAQAGLGLIEIMGFDTNYPHGHTDGPPHVHMHLRWPFNKGTQIGHLYIGADGRIERNQLGITGYGLPDRTFGPGQTYTTVAYTGEAAYGLMIGADGGLTISTKDGAGVEHACQITPTAEGFIQAAQLACDGRKPVVISANDDIATGDITVKTGSLVEHFRYDVDSGALLSSPQQPPLPASVVVPTATVTLGLTQAEAGAAPHSGSD